MSKIKDTIIDVPVNDSDYDYIKFEERMEMLETKFPSCKVSELSIADDGSGYHFVLSKK
jgi:hypothetical protein